MIGHGEKKSRKLEQFVTAMLVHPTVEAAAHSIGIGIATAFRWLKDPNVIARFREARRDAMHHAMARLQEAARESVECLCEVQRSGESEPARVSAARTILEQALRAVDTEDVLVRLDNLERAVKSQKALPGGPRVSVTQENQERKGNDHDRENHKAAGTAGGFRR